MRHFLSFIIALCIKLTIATTTKNGFSVELIHSHSIYSPFPQKELTDGEMFEHLKKSSQVRAAWLEMSKIMTYNQSHQMTLQPIIDHVQSYYMVKLHIGSGRVPQYLLFDTAFDLPWVQCHPCNQCYPQKEPFYWPNASKTYRPLSCNHIWCMFSPCKEAICQFYGSYKDASFLRGNMAAEFFEGIEIVFGCTRAVSNYSFGGIKLPISGVFGMNKAPIAFPWQSYKYTQRRFSHCFVPEFTKTTSYLRFGNDSITKPNYQTTKIIDSYLYWYFVQLNDVSVNNQRLNLPPGTFHNNLDGSGGCFFDSGSTLTYMIPKAYKIVEEAFIKYFSVQGLKPTSLGGPKTQLCYKTGGTFSHWPTMTLHFEGADLLLEPLNLFYHKGDNEFCLVISTVTSFTLIGTSMQQDVNFVYDLNQNLLSFGRETCAKM
ncbi:hypothetical protein LUZ63_002509 [Rhynchospora breviuscula]|uniref:Peptidase A1 domain-containing protein n=1 Tax=Rhynchospora breviuscula TaxID=2022672 RepID=A0A9Q0CYY4_9POAL|nr:hypothetical protein LUZ63_002509 [Rhynchospora breviuscula]